MKLSRELKTAFIILGGILLFILGFSYLKSSSLFDSSQKFYAVYDNVNGLTPGTTVDINGLPVGTVQDIKFLDDRGNLVVTFSVDKEFRFSKNSEVEVYDTGIIGGKNMRIIPVFDGSAMASSGDTLISTMKPGITELVTQRLTPLQEKLESLLNSADTVLVGMDDVLDEGSRQNLRKGIAQFDDVMANLSSVTKSLDRFLSKNEQSLNNSLAEVEKITTNLSKVSTELADADLGNTINTLENTVNNLNSVITKMQSGEGSMAKLLNDEQLYANLNDASGQLKLLLEDMRLNPKRYVHFSVFGKKNKEYQSPDNSN